MTVESASFISGLVPAYPPGSDSISEGDDHLRLIKSVLQGTFPNANAAINGIHTKATAPTSTTAGQLWFDTNNNVLKIRDEADAGWVTLNVSPVTDFKLLGSTTIGWVLPTVDGVSGQFLTTDAAGNLDWASAAGDELPSQTGNSGKYLTTDGSSASWNNEIPSQTGNSGKFLTTDGSSASWATDNSAFGGAADGYRSFSVNKGGVDQGSVATGTLTKVTWPTIDWQTSTGTPFASDKFTCDLSGKYHFYFALKLTGNVLYDNMVALYKNGSLVRYANYFLAYDSGANTGVPTMQMEATLDLSASGTPDYVEVYVHQESGGDQTVDGSATATWFNGHRIE